jgi:hypothetical protein
MNRQYLDCRCALYPDGHLVPKTKKLKHALELKRVVIQVGLFYIISPQAYLDELIQPVQVDATTIVPLSETTATMSHSMDPDELASRIVALTISDDRDKDHDSDGTNAMPVPQALSLAQSSIQYLVNDNHRIHVDCDTGSSSRSQVSVAEIFSSYRPLDAPSRKMEELIQAVERDMQTSGQSLSFEDVPEVPVLQSLLDAATNIVRSSASSLALVKSSNPKVIGHKASAIQMLQSLDGRISQLRTLLPAQANFERVSVDTGEYRLSSSFCSSAHWHLIILIRPHPS